MMTFGRTIQVRLLSSDHYQHTNVSARVDQIGNSNNPLHDIDGTHWRTLLEPLRDYGYSYTRGIMTVQFLSIVNLEGITHDTEMHTVNGVEMLKDGYCTV